MDHLSRFRALRSRMSEAGIEAMLVTHPPDVRYLCGFTGSNAALAIAGGRAAFFTDGRYTEQARQQVQGARVRIAPLSAQTEACAWLAGSGAAQAFFDPVHTSVADLTRYRKALAGRSGAGRAVSGGRRRISLQPLHEPLIATLRMVKDADELKPMGKAARLGEELFAEILPKIRAWIREDAIAAELEHRARDCGAEGMSFDTILVGGRRSALPHGRASRRPLPPRGFVTLDFGVILEGYCSDMTRTVFLGRATRRERYAYDAVRAAELAAIHAVRPGALCGEVDEAARGVLRKAGLAAYFSHSTGHGVGLEIHEGPRVAASQSLALAPGMIVTIEPGVYIPGRYGIRLEDMVAVTASGARLLTTAPAGWTEI